MASSGQFRRARRAWSPSPTSTKSGRDRSCQSTPAGATPTSGRLSPRSTRRSSRFPRSLTSKRSANAWLRAWIVQDAPFDQLARELLTSQGESYKDAAANFFCVPKTPDTITDPLYLQKDLAEATAQLFLGIRLQCAQCHNHPYERWTQDDYLSLAAFFTQIKRTRLGKAGPKGRPGAKPRPPGRSPGPGGPLATFLAILRRLNGVLPSRM